LVCDRVSLRVQQIDVQIETKTKDNVFAVVFVSVQYQVRRGGGIPAEGVGPTGVHVDAHLAHARRSAMPRQVIREKVYDAVYRLTNPHEQIRAYVFDVVRATLPRMDLDQVQ
jgi:regulator of protease activity HflC (stomatin/prohibitin superfamily)